MTGIDIAIHFENLHFGYDETEILHGVSADLPAGDIYALFGPNGSGKTTLLKCLAGLVKTQKGEITICRKNLRRANPREVSRLLSYVPQEHPLSFPFSVREIVLMGRTPHLGGVRGPKTEDVQMAETAISLVGISELSERPYTQLSGGQRQLVMIARALAQDTPVVILDEPTSALDFKNQIHIWKMLSMLKEQGKTVIVCTHDPNHVLWFCDTVLVLCQGRLLRQGPVREVMVNELLNQLYGDVCEKSGNTVRPSMIG